MTMPRKKKVRKKSEAIVRGIVGIGLDEKEGHRRITRTEEMVLVGGSEETHKRMQETAIRFAEKLEERGCRLPDIPAQEALEMLREAIEKTGT